VVGVVDHQNRRKSGPIGIPATLGALFKNGPLMFDPYLLAIDAGREDA